MADRTIVGRALGSVAMAAAVLIMVAACGAPASPAPASSAPPTLQAPTSGAPASARPASPTPTFPTPDSPTRDSPTPDSTPSVTSSPQPGPLRVFGLGDSVPAADSCDCRGYVEQAADLIAPAIRRPVQVRNDAVDGWTTVSVVRALRSGDVRRDLAGGAGLVIIEAGANDLPLGRITDPDCQPVESSPCFRPTLTAVGKALTTAVDLIRSTDPDQHPRIVLMGYWNVSVDGPTGRRRGPAYLKDSNDLTLALNRVVRTVVARTGTIYVDAYTPLKGLHGDRDPSPDLLPDGDHPNRAGHRLLAEALLERLKQVGAIAAWSAGR